MRYGTIGTGWITDSFIQGANMVDGMELTAVYSRNKEKGQAFAEKYGKKKIFTDLEEMASSNDIDAVYIASPNMMHYPQSKLFLEHGKHVICEKPVTVKPSEVKELIELAKKKDLVYMEAIMMLHLPARKKLLETFDKLGSITMARFDFSRISSKYQSLVSGNLPNIFNPKCCTGSLMDLGIYCVYPAIDFFGVPEKIIASAGFISTGSDGYGNSVFVYKDKQVNMSYSKIAEGKLGSEIMGEKGTILIESISKLNGIKLVLSDGTEEVINGDVPKPVLMSGEAQDFYNFITDMSAHEKEYKYASEMSVKVCETMEKIRQLAGIKFG